MSMLYRRIPEETPQPPAITGHTGAGAENFTTYPKPAMSSQDDTLTILSSEAGILHFHKFSYYPQLFFCRVYKHTFTY